MIIEITPAELNENESQRRFLSYRLHAERFIASRVRQAISDAGMDHGHCSIVRLPQCDDSIRYSVQEVVQEAEQVHPHTQAPQIPRPLCGNALGPQHQQHRHSVQVAQCAGNRQRN